jgi:hypothetical protein
MLRLGNGCALIIGKNIYNITKDVQAKIRIKNNITNI